MSVTVGPSTWWIRSKEAADYYARICPIGTILGDGSAVFCKTVGQAWIVAPNCTQIGDQWVSGRWNNTLIVGSGNCLCCICEWPNVCNRLTCCGFNPCDWFIPNQSILLTAYQCRQFWDTFSQACYWSSTESSSAFGWTTGFSDASTGTRLKDSGLNVRAFRCINLS